MDFSPSQSHLSTSTRRGCSLPLLGVEVPLPVGVFAHEGGTVLVCLNGLRLLAFNDKSLDD